MPEKDNYIPIAHVQRTSYMYSFVTIHVFWGGGREAGRGRRREGEGGGGGPLRRKSGLSIDMDHVLHVSGCPD